MKFEKCKDARFTFTWSIINFSDVTMETRLRINSTPSRNNRRLRSILFTHPNLVRPKWKCTRQERRRVLVSQRWRSSCQRLFRILRTEVHTDLSDAIEIFHFFRIQRMFLFLFEENEFDFSSFFFFFFEKWWKYESRH